MKNFGDILKRKRKQYDKTQAQLVSSDLSLSSSLIAMLETNKRGLTPLSRDQVWHFITVMSASPSDADELLEAAKLSTLRSEKEELEIQEKFNELKEIWIYARIIRDKDLNWFKVVSKNITERGVKYCYFTANEVQFKNFHTKLIQAGIGDEYINDCLECYLLPEELFPSNFAIYNPGLPNMYCCGTVTEHGKAVAFYTSSEGTRLYELLENWKERIVGEHQIPLRDAQQIFPESGAGRHSSFTRET